jgi:hypothetical protein
MSRNRGCFYDLLIFPSEIQVEVNIKSQKFDKTVKETLESEIFFFKSEFIAREISGPESI